MTIIWNSAPQGSDEWLAARMGVITGSRANDARDRLKSGAPGAKMLTYAMDCAREREGGTALAHGQNAAMRIGHEQEPIARMMYEARTGELVEEVGFAHTHDGRFGCSLDGKVGSKGAVEIKTQVGSTTMFKALVDGDIDDYRAQCLMAMWLLTLDWVDLVLWAPDLQLLRVVRIHRDEDEIAQFEADMLAFDKLVETYRGKLSNAIAACRESASDPIHIGDAAASVLANITIQRASAFEDEDPDAGPSNPPQPAPETVDHDLVLETDGAPIKAGVR